ncbi:MAG: TRAP transporter substrate-binding protein DctP [Pseudomonadales bacterium]
MYVFSPAVSMNVAIFRKLFVVMFVSFAMLPVVQAKTIKIATISPDGLSWMKQLRLAAKDIEKQTEGRVKFKIYPGGVQGDDYTVLRKMRIGQLQGGGFAAGSLTRFYPDLQIYNLPLQFRSFEEVDFIRKRMDTRINAGLAKAGIISFGLTETGFAYLLSKDPVKSVDDLKSLKAWVPDGDPISAQLLQSFNISPIPLSITDVLAGLQTGLINAVAVPPIVALALQWHNHVDYMMNLPLIYIYSIMAVDEKTFSKISAADQKIVLTVMNALYEKIDAENRIDNQKGYDALVAQGIKVIEPDASDIPAWRALADQSVTDLVESGQITRESLELYEGLLMEFRAQNTSVVSSVGE